MIRYLVLLLALVFSTATVTADSRSDAKARFQAGVKAYSAGDYRAAIREFTAAQDLFPADLNNYNLALCYDKLGEPEPAIQHYRAFLDKQPTSDKKAEIEASIARLESAAKSAAAKAAARAKEEEAARAAEAKKAEEDAKKAEELRRSEEAKRPPVVEDRGGVGTTGTPGGSGTVAPEQGGGDRLSRIDINQIRDQRMGGGSSGMIDTRDTRGTQPPAAGAPQGTNRAAAIDVNAHANSAAAPPTAAPTAAPTADPTGQPTDKPKVTPVYKKWWFWAVVAVSAYVVISIASEDSNDNTATRVMPMTVNGANTSAGAGGMTLLRW